MKRIFAAVLMTVMIFSVSCAPVDMEYSDASTKATQNIKETKDNRIQLWTDEETGVQYIIYHYVSSDRAGAGITPRLNADGSLYTED